MFLMCVLTVWSLIPKRLPISQLVWPEETKRRISRYRSDGFSPGGVGRAEGAEWF